jgi:hypothetical protein
MKGRTEENIRKSMEKMHKIAEIVFDCELEVIPSYVEDNPPENTHQSIWYLGKSIQLLAEADFYIGIDYSDHFNGCMMENDIARRYGIRSTHVRVIDIMPDVVELEKQMWEQVEKLPAR